MKFCSVCGSDALVFEVPEGDNRCRHQCTQCGEIFYQNPKLVCGTLPFCVETKRILLCKRAIEPRKGFWTLPAGFMENGESLAQAAARETYEEAGAVAQSLRLLSTISVPQFDQVHVFYLCSVLDNTYSIGVESLDVQWFSIDQLPWDFLAFLTVKKTIAFFLQSIQSSLSSDWSEELVQPLDWVLAPA